MANWTNYWRIVTPASRKSSYVQPSNITLDDGMNLNTSGYASFSTMSWFSNLLKGSVARMQRYKQYDAMDIGDINRALDIIAEEMSSPDKRTGLPFIIEYQTEDNQIIPDTTSTTIRAALRHWSKFHRLHKRIFNVSRIMVKYGDCFFRKTSDTKKWEYIDPTRVIGIEVDAEGNKLAYHIRPSSFQNSASAQAGGTGISTGGISNSLDICPAESIIHFTLSDDMGETAPFGLSCLQAAFKDYQKLTMLEDAAIIYRIVRAPERRVFYIDVGNMPQQRVKGYLESIRNDMRQRKQPNTADSNSTDSTYNAETISQDFFFATNAAGRGSKVETMPGGTSWDIPELDYFQNKVFRALRVPSSYMKGQDSTVPGSQYNDGKVGVAYMEERIFANFVMRLQSSIDTIFDEQFKIYLNVTGINIDPDLFVIKLTEPQNFAKYKQAALDSDLISSFKSIEDTQYLSKRFMLERFLGLTSDEIQMNELLLKQERGLTDGNLSLTQLIYDPDVKIEKSSFEPAEPSDLSEPGGPPEESSPEESPPEESPPEEGV